MKNYLLASILVLISDLVCGTPEDQNGSKFKSKKLALISTQCGITSEWTFNNWEKSIVTNTPTVFPKNDLELKNYLKTIKEHNCKARPVGATHSAGGLVLENNSTDTIAISLASYKPDDADWNANIIKENGESSVRIPSGASLLDLVSFIRPKNLFTPTQTAGFIFAVGGVVANTVHGGFYGKGFSNYYVTKMRVMLSNGDIKIIDDKEEIKYWRQSFGLLGMITSVEIELEEKKDFVMDTIKENFKKSDFTKEQFNQVLANARQNNATYGEFFFNAYTLELFSVIFNNEEGTAPKSDDDCSWYYSKAACFPQAFCSYQYNFGDITLSQSCRMKKESTFDQFYNNYEASFPEIRTKGDATWISPGDSYGNEMADILNKISKIPLLAHDGTLCKILASTTSLVSQYLVKKSQAESDDGYWIRTAPKAHLIGYFFPADKLYDAIKVYQNMVITLLEGTNPVSKYTTFKFNQPCEFRFVTLNSTLASKYQVPEKQDSEWVVIEALNLDDGLEDFKWAFAQLEHEWIQIGGIPHLGKIWGFDYKSLEKGIRPEAFSKEFARTILSDDQKSDFYEYQAKVDPEKLFSGGLAIELFKPKNDDLPKFIK